MCVICEVQLPDNLHYTGRTDHLFDHVGLLGLALKQRRQIALITRDQAL